MEEIDMKKMYKFNDCNGKIYWYEFENREEAQRFAYVHGLCFLGS